MAGAKGGKKRWREVYRQPTVLGIIGLAGLICALVGDGWWDVLSWALLGYTCAVIVWALAVKRS
ncbi:hypothetical protein [Caulobacter mirabilis]|uniref:Uncharacterized protein n=1 Tax=Caulobacter mirabilis TaxID=69666 RepID=A0A2D2B0Z5_9CAUL|nr:hypothetical protein [Caulobacter mirabilis]ATQ43923.1 hypothetical protein CSW64_16755 [Caulobacter mirabilis]